MSKNITAFLLFMVIMVLLFFNLDGLIGFFRRIGNPNPLKDVKTYKVYYDHLTPEIIEEIKKLDLVILEPAAVTSREIREIREQGKTLVYGYISVIDIEPYDSLKLNLIKEEDYLKINGEKVYVSDHDCYLADITSSHYHDVLLKLIQKKIIGLGFDGVFLDTLDRMEYLKDEKQVERCIQGYREFLAKLKTNFSDLSVIQNRAFNSFSQFSGKYVDGILYEDFSYNKMKDSEYYQKLLASILKTSKRNGCRVLVISFDQDGETEKFCRKNGWIYLYHPEDSVYNTWYN